MTFAGLGLTTAAVAAGSADTAGASNGAAWRSTRTAAASREAAWDSTRTAAASREAAWDSTRTPAAFTGRAASSTSATGPAGHASVARRHVSAEPCLVPGYKKTLNHLWRPDMAAAVAYARSRVGDVAFAVRTDHRFYGYRANHVEWSASVVKAMLMVAYLDMPVVANHPINGYVSLLIPMIEHSDNIAATTVIGIVGLSGLRALAARVGMENFEPVLPIWGETRVTPADQTKFFYRIDGYIAPPHRKFGMHLLASITRSQRWGIGEVTPRGWTPYFKGGWGSGTGLIDNQVALLKRGCSRASIAVLTMHDGSHDYGKETLRGIFSRLLRGFPKGTPSR